MTTNLLGGLGDDVLSGTDKMSGNNGDDRLTAAPGRTSSELQRWNRDGRGQRLPARPDCYSFLDAAIAFANKQETAAGDSDLSPQT